MSYPIPDHKQERQGVSHNAPTESPKPDSDSHQPDPDSHQEQATKPDSGISHTARQDDK